MWHGIRVVTPRFVSDAHRLNLAVHVWVVDGEQDMARLLEWGVDGIQTDRPDVLSRVLEGVGRLPHRGELVPHRGGRVSRPSPPDSDH